MKRVASRHREALERWVQEACRAELTHWIALLVSGLFFLWNPPWLGGVMVLYAVALNGPCIVVQRYNRPRLMRILGEKCDE
jgi:glycosyl-4,4'-diaponeurosporenoate acyltransferase